MNWIELFKMIAGILVLAVIVGVGFGFYAAHERDYIYITPRVGVSATPSTPR